MGKKAAEKGVDDLASMESKTITPREIEKYFKELPENQEPAQSMLDARDYYEQMARKRAAKMPPEMSQAIKSEQEGQFRERLRNWEHPLDVAQKQEAAQMQKQFAESVDEPTRLANYEASLRAKEQEIANREIEEFTKKKQKELMDKYGPDYFKEGTNADIKVISDDEIKAAEEALKRKKKASGMLLAAPAAMEEEDNSFVSKLKKAMADKYEQYGEAVADKYNKASDWAELLKQKQDERMKKLNPDWETRGSSFGMTPEEYDSMVQDMGMSSPAMGITKAVKTFGPAIGKSIDKMTNLDFAKTGQGMSEHYKKILSQYKDYIPENVAGLKKATKSSIDQAAKMGRDLDYLYPEIKEQLLQYGDEVPDMINSAAKNIRAGKVPTDLRLNMGGQFYGLPVEKQKETINQLIKHYEQNPKDNAKSLEYLNNLLDIITNPR